MHYAGGSRGSMVAGEVFPPQGGKPKLLSKPGFRHLVKLKNRSYET
jgi:hypothetical protein